MMHGVLPKTCLYTTEINRKFFLNLRTGYFAADVVTILRHSIVSAWDQIMTAIFRLTEAKTLEVSVLF